MIVINGIAVTEAMRVAGEQFASDAMDVQCQQHFDGLGGCGPLNWDYFKNNTDLLKKYLEGEITSVEGIYIAMHREGQGYGNNRP